MTPPDAARPEVEAFARRREALLARAAEACRRAGRPPDAVTLIAVSKTFPAERIAAAAEAGQVDFGENRVQELAPKAEALPGARRGGRLCWHMIGRLQRNKARDAAAYADVFHALDSVRLADELERRCAEAGRVLPCLVQVNISGEESKGGVAPEGLPALLEAAAARPHLRLRGLMGIARLADDPEAARPEFALLRRLRDGHAPDHPGLEWLSMGMSGDFEAAIAEGATHIRLGSALFGSR